MVAFPFGVAGWRRLEQRLCRGVLRCEGENLSRSPLRTTRKGLGYRTVAIVKTLVGSSEVEPTRTMGWCTAEIPDRRRIAWPVGSAGGRGAGAALELAVDQAGFGLEAGEVRV